MVIDRELGTTRIVSITPGAALAASLRALGLALRRAVERVRQRRALARLDQRLLRDVGITRADAARETRKPFWRV